jgi:transposase-like protein
VAVETFSEQSYRRGTSNFSTIGVVPVPRSTGQRWVMESKSGSCDQQHEKLQVIMADATGFNRRPDAIKGVDNQGEVRVSIGLTREGSWVALGAHTEKNWEQIAAELRDRVGSAGQKPELAVLDGGRGMAEAFSTVANRVQRCEWHLVHQLRFALYDDGVKKPDQQPHLEKLAAILQVQTPAGELEKIQPEQRAGLEKKLFGIAAEMDGLIAELERGGHDHAATYLKSAQGHTFRWLAFWLKTGFRCPRTTSHLERLMREIGRRLKKIAFGWSEQGAAQMTRILIRRIVNTEEWETHWKKVLRLDDKVKILFRSVCQAKL